MSPEELAGQGNAAVQRLADDTQEPRYAKMLARQLSESCGLLVGSALEACVSVLTAGGNRWSRAALRRGAGAPAHRARGCLWVGRLGRLGGLF